MTLLYHLTLAFSVLSLAVAQISDSSFSAHPNSLKLPSPFDPIIPAYWTGLPHHRRTPFDISPDGTTAYLAYLDTTYASVIVQPIDPSTFEAKGSAITIRKAREVSGIVAQNDGFAVLVKIDTDAPGIPFPIATVVRYKGTTLAWERPINGPSVPSDAGRSTSPDLNGDLVYSAKAKLYAAYFVVSGYEGGSRGHYGDAVQYVDESGEIQITAGTSTWGCSHNTGIAFEAADEVPYASICAEDSGGIWLNTLTRTMSGVRIANENYTNGVSGEPMGGMGGSYSSLSRFIGSNQYIFAWQSRGAVRMTQDDEGFVDIWPRWLNHNVAISIMLAKDKLKGPEAISEVGSGSGDSQVIWVTKSASDDHQNVHVAAFNEQYALVTYETLTNPDCQPVPLSCTGAFAGTYMQLVDNTGAVLGSPVVAKDAYVAGDMVNVGDKICWPYVSMDWDLSQPKSNGTYTSQMSFACMGLSGSTPNPAPTTPPTTPTTTPPTTPATTPPTTPTTTPPTTPTTPKRKHKSKPKKTRTTRDTRQCQDESDGPNEKKAWWDYKLCTSDNECDCGFKCKVFRAGRGLCVSNS